MDDDSKLDENTSSIVKTLLDAVKAAKDLNEQMNAEDICSSLSEIAEDFNVDLTDGSKDFGKSLEEIIRKFLLNGSNGKLIQQQLQGFYDNFAKATSDDNLPPSEIEALHTVYRAASNRW